MNQSYLEILLWMIPTAYFLTSAIVRNTKNTETAWMIAFSITGANLLLSLGLLFPIQVTSSTSIISPVASLMLLMISLLGFIITKYSYNYLHGEDNLNIYTSGILFLLATVSVLIISQNLAVVAFAWFATSLGLHILLTYYPERPGAQLAAGKKFIFSRTAELLFMSSLLLIYMDLGTLTYSGIEEALPQRTTSPSIQIAGVLFVLSVVLKSAQFPFHGWITQVMEAPTPVSALLHAGVVNIGGFVLIQMAALLSASPLSQFILICFGSATVVLSSLSMIAQSSIKLRLAYSTCAQMGFMLIECGLGLYDLALLHLLAHSAYKAYSFLAAGETVNNYVLSRLETVNTMRSIRFSPLHHVLSLVLSASLVYTTLFIFGSFLDVQISFFSISILTLAGATLIAPAIQLKDFMFLRAIGYIVLLSGVYILWHMVFGEIVTPQDTEIVLASIVILSFLTLWALQSFLFSQFKSPSLHRAQTRLYQYCVNAFYLDLVISNFILSVWPSETMKKQLLETKSSTQVVQGDEYARS